METIEVAEIEILIEGRVVKSSLDTFCDQLKEATKSLDRELVTDGDFEAAEKDAKFLKSAEKSLKSAKDGALKQAEDIQKLFAAIDDVSEEARQARLGLERQIKARKEERRKEILDEYSTQIAGGLGRAWRPRLDAVMKGKRSFESMESAVVDELKKLNYQIHESQSLLDQFLEKHEKSLIPDASALLQKPAEELKVELERRVERAQAEAERKRLEAEKAELEQAQKAQAEAEQKPEPTKEQPAPIKPEPKPNEMAVFKKRVIDAFACVKEARLQLKNPENIERAQQFSVKVSAAFNSLEGGVE